MRSLFAIALLCGLATNSACAKDSREELRSWVQSACACEDLSCAETQRLAFWKLVQEFADETPTAQRSSDLDSLIDQGQGCLESLEIDIYALN